jgi:hypothetical protein
VTFVNGIFQQHAFGLRFSSTRKFSELNCSPRQDYGQLVDLKWGLTPDRLSEPSTVRGLYQASKNELLFALPSVASYHVTRDSVVVSPREGASDDAVRLFLFGSAIGALLHLNGVLALHGSAVRLRGGGAAVFTGNSTAGKSTLAAALGQRGYMPIADDIAAVRFDEHGVAWVYPGLSRTKLWSDALHTLNVSPQALERVREGMDKFILPVETWQEPERLTHVYEILPRERGEVSLRSLAGMEKIELLDRQTYRRRFVDALETRGAHIRQLAQLASQVSVQTIVRPRERATLVDMVDALEKGW